MNYKIKIKKQKKNIKNLKIIIKKYYTKDNIINFIKVLVFMLFKMKKNIKQVLTALISMNV